METQCSQISKRYSNLSNSRKISIRRAYVCLNEKKKKKREETNKKDSGIHKTARRSVQRIINARDT